jgi:hypothetical protein
MQFSPHLFVVDLVELHVPSLDGKPLRVVFEEEGEQLEVVVEPSFAHVPRGGVSGHNVVGRHLK